MTWQMLVWNIFIWTFCGAMITLNHVSMLWLTIPAIFTMWSNGGELLKKQSDEAEKINKQMEDLIKALDKK